MDLSAQEATELRIRAEVPQNIINELKSVSDPNKEIFRQRLGDF